MFTKYYRYLGEILKIETICLLLILSIKTFAQASDLANLQFSDVFKTYSSKHQRLLVQYPSGFWGQKWTHYRIIYETKRKWYLADYFSNPLKLFNDSISVRKCNDCKLVFKQFLSKEKLLKPEKEITSTCRKRTLITNNKGDSVVSEQDLNLVIDAGSQALEYRINKKRKSIVQKSPEWAVEICPENEERKIFREIVNAIQSVR